MKSQQHTIFPITIVYNKSLFTTKALKYSYSNKEVLYKIALPSNVSPVQQFWISKSNGQWKQILGADADKTLTQGIINAIKMFEHIPTIQANADNELKLKSA